MRPAPPHPDAAQAAITTELVRVTLTGAERPELVAPLVEASRPRRTGRKVRR